LVEAAEASVSWLERHWPLSERDGPALRLIRNTTTGQDAIDEARYRLVL